MKQLLLACILLCLTQNTTHAADNPTPSIAALTRVAALRADTMRLQKDVETASARTTTVIVDHGNAISRQEAANVQADATHARKKKKEKKKKNARRPSLDNDSIETIVNEHIAKLDILKASLAEQLDNPETFSSTFIEHLGTETNKINGRDSCLAVIHNNQDDHPEEVDTQGGLHRTIYMQFSSLRKAKKTLQEKRMENIVNNLDKFQKSKERQLANWYAQDGMNVAQSVTHYIDSKYL